MRQRDREKPERLSTGKRLRQRYREKPETLSNE